MSAAREHGLASDDWVLQPAAQHRRRPYRGLLALVSVMFVSFLGLGSVTATAAAGDMKGEPEVTEVEAAVDDVAGSTDPIEDDEAEASDETEADPSDETDTDPTDGNESGSDESSEGTEDEDEATADTGEEDDASDESDAEATSDESDGKAKGTGGNDTPTQADVPGSPSGDGIQPVLVLGNPDCSTLVPGSIEFKQEPVRDATIPLSFEVNGTTLTGTLVINVNEPAQTVSFTLTGDLVAAGVIVKGGPNANFYNYLPGGNASDTGLHAPVNPNNGNFYGLSHLSFCLIAGEAGEGPVAGIDVAKTCPGTIEAGGTIRYDITVTNTGTEALTDITVVDSRLGDITAAFVPALSAGLAVGASATATVFDTPDPGEDPVENTVTATGTGVESETEVSESESCLTDVLPPPLGGGGESPPPPGVGQGPPPAGGAVSGGTAFTGSDTLIWALIAAALALLGAGVLLATRKGHA